jgi:brassinosteroid-6-oxidase 1
VESGELIKASSFLFFLCSGFVIPKGWRIYVYTRENNYDPFVYPEPLTFNPWRWLVRDCFIYDFFSYLIHGNYVPIDRITYDCKNQDKSLESQNYFFIFGGGSRQCPGKELGIAEISTFLHYFVTRYR